MRINKIFAVMMVAMLTISMLIGCGKKEESGSQTDSQITGGTVATDLYILFLDEIKNNTDLIQVSDKLLEADCFKDIATGSMAVEEGYLNGFNDEIKGFKNGVMFAPMIGTIPFVGYIFETDNPDDLMQTLADHAELNWNICTVADEMVVEKYDNYVFFVMAPTSFDQ